MTYTSRASDSSDAECVGTLLTPKQSMNDQRLEVVTLAGTHVTYHQGFSVDPQTFIVDHSTLFNEVLDIISNQERFQGLYDESEDFQRRMSLVGVDSRDGTPLVINWVMLECETFTICINYVESCTLTLIVEQPAPPAPPAPAVLPQQQHHRNLLSFQRVFPRIPAQPAIIPHAQPAIIPAPPAIIPAPPDVQDAIQHDEAHMLCRMHFSHFSNPEKNEPCNGSCGRSHCFNEKHHLNKSLLRRFTKMTPEEYAAECAKRIEPNDVE